MYDSTIATASRGEHSNTQFQYQPRLSYYITRTNGTLVPLIPADELPPNVRLQGVPHVLNADQVFGLQPVAVLPYTGRTFKLENGMMPPRSSSQPPGSCHTRSYSSTDSYRSNPTDTLSYPAQIMRNLRAQRRSFPSSKPPHQVATNWRSAPTSDPQTIIDAIVGTKSGSDVAAKLGYRAKSTEALSPCGNTPDPDKKEYCTYWIRHGECDYIQQGCLFRHEMPDKATLGKIGFRSTPRWWLEKTQTIKLDGGAAAIGSTMKHAAWLKTMRGRDTDQSDSGSETLDSGSSYGIPVETTAPRAETKTNGLGVMTSNPSRMPLSPLENVKERKQSTVSDLIDFEALLPNSPSPVPSLEPPNSSDKAVAIDSTRGGQPNCDSQQNEISTQVFIPVGEDPKVHVADAKRKKARNQPKHARQRAGTDVRPRAYTKSELRQKKHGTPQNVTTYGMSLERAPHTHKESVTIDKNTTMPTTSL